MEGFPLPDIVYQLENYPGPNNNAAIKVNSKQVKRSPPNSFDGAKEVYESDSRVVHLRRIDRHKVRDFQKYNQENDPAHCDGIDEHAVFAHVEPAGNECLPSAKHVDTDRNDIAEIEEHKIGSLYEGEHISSVSRFLSSVSSVL
jgi:hypothetical protein